jgi:hypothetical protein
MESVSLPRLTLGIDIGKKHDPTAVCIAEAQDRPTGGQMVTHFVVRHLERLPLGTPYPKVVERIALIAKTVQLRTMTPPVIYVDATGVGQPIVDLLQARQGLLLVAVTFTSGQKRQLRAGHPPQLTLGKEFLACRLQALLAGNRIHLPSTPEGHALAAELHNYEIRVDQGGHARFGAFRAGTHDDLATALGLAVQKDPEANLHTAIRPCKHSETRSKPWQC